MKNGRAKNKENYLDGRKSICIAFGGYGLLGILYILMGTITSFQAGGQIQWLFLTILLFFSINICLGLRLVKESVHTSLTSFHVFLNSVLIGFWLFCRSYNGDCSVDDFSTVAALNCNPEYNSNALPADTLIFAMMTPLLYAYIFMNVSRLVLQVSWMITIAWIATCIGLFNAFNNINSLIIYIAFSVMILVFKHENQRKITCLVLKNENSQLEIKRIVEKSEKDAKQIQTRLGNVAHDLKTPASITICGVANIETAVKDCQVAVESGLIDMKGYVESIKNITEAATHIKTVNEFMVGTVNRFLEYSKIQEGVKLTAKYDTICLDEALVLPKLYNQTLNSDCMHIEFLPNVGESICSHIITDDTWLKENLLCLLSNAAKYSDEGTITVSMSLADVEDLPEHHHTNVGVVDSDALIDATDAVIETTTNGISRQTSVDSDQCDETDLAKPKERRWSNTPIMISGSRRSKVGVDPSGLAGERDIEGGINVTKSRCNSLASLNSIQINSSFDIVPTPVTPRTAEKQKIRSSSSISPSRRLSSRSDISINIAIPSRSTTMLLFEVEDQGIGISEEKMKDLFSPFQQAQSHAGGTGLGLFSLGKRVEALNGYYGVRARTDKTQGTNFWFAIPYKPDNTAAKHTLNRQRRRSTPKYKSPTAIAESSKVPPHINHQSNEDKSASCLEQSGITSVASDTVSMSTASEMKSNGMMEKIISKNHFPESNIDYNSDDESSAPSSGKVYFPYKLNILLVDDSSSILKIVGKSLRKYGHTVVEAVNGANALKKIEIVRSTPGMQPFDVVIIDLQMPVMDGIEFTKRLRKIESGLQNINPLLKIHQKVILSSANSEDYDTLELAKEAGIDGNLEKPLNIDTFHQLCIDINKSAKSEEN